MKYEAEAKGEESRRLRAIAPSQEGKVKVTVIGAIALGALIVYAFTRPWSLPAPTIDNDAIGSPQLSDPAAMEPMYPEPTADAENVASDVTTLEPADPRPALRDKLEKSRQQFSRIEHRFETQDVEAGRSDRFHDDVLMRFSESGLQDIVELVAADCRQTLCGIDVRYRSGSELGDKIARVINEWLRKLPGCSYHVPGELLLTPSEDGQVSQRLWVECHQH